MVTTKKKVLLAASIAGLMGLAASSSAFAEEMAMPSATGESVPCYGINACKGTGDCGGKGYSCAGKNACKGQGFVNLKADVCTRINGGSLTPSAS